MENPNNQVENSMGKADLKRDHDTHTPINQAMSVVSPARRRRKATKPKGSKMIGVLKGTIIRVQRLFDDIYKPEIEILFGVVVYLQTAGKMTGTKDDIMRWMGFRTKAATRKAYRRLESLSDKGYLLRVLNKAGEIHRRGYGFALSERGHQVVLAFDREWDRSAAWSRKVERLEDVVLYLDTAHRVLRRNQEIIMTPELSERLKSIRI